MSLMLVKHLAGRTVLNSVRKFLLNSTNLISKMSTSSPAITHVLFDFDGTLVNTIDCMEKIFEQIIEENGKQITQEIKDFIPNMTSFRSLIELINLKLGSALVYEEFAKDFLDKMAVSDLQIMPGVKKLVEHLHKNNIPMAVATGNSKPFYEKLTSKFGDFFPKHIDHYVCAYDDQEVGATKPSPDVYFVAAKRFSKPPESMKNVLIFEDSITGIQGALASGGLTVFVSQDQNCNKPEHEKLLNNCVQRLKSLEDFEPESLGLPPY